MKKIFELTWLAAWVVLFTIGAACRNIDGETRFLIMFVSLTGIFSLLAYICLQNLKK